DVRLRAAPGGGGGRPGAVGRGAEAQAPGDPGAGVFGPDDPRQSGGDPAPEGAVSEHDPARAGPAHRDQPGAGPRGRWGGGGGAGGEAVVSGVGGPPRTVGERLPDPVAAQLERLVQGLRPGQELARYAGWGREMRRLYGSVEPAVLRGAVTRCLALETDLPK